MYIHVCLVFSHHLQVLVPLGPGRGKGKGKRKGSDASRGRSRRIWRPVPGAQGDEE
jgi:hypothetical protein